jgi:hypothetical protein
VALYICGAMPDLRLAAPAILILTFAIFAPVPVGLAFTCFLALKWEKKVRNVHTGFLQTIDHVRIEPPTKLDTSFAKIRTALGGKGKGFWAHLHQFLHGDKDDTR